MEEVETGKDNPKESFSSKIRRTFGWKRKIILEKEREDGPGEVTIELPAKHEGMFKETAENSDVDESDIDVKGGKNEIEVDNSYIEVMTTLTTLFTPNFEVDVGNEDVENVKFTDKLKCQKTDHLVDETTKHYDIPVQHLPEAVSYPCHPTWLSTQSYQPGSVLDQDMDPGTALKEVIFDFEKEYKDVQEIVKKDHIKKSISILLESSKSY